jgi:hypothetical protein
MTINKILVDAHVEVDMNLFYRKRDPEEYAQQLEQACKDFLWFIKDHRSQDVNDAYVVREYGYKCGHCGWTYEKDEEKPECCEDAIREWASPAQLIELGFEEI